MTGVTLLMALALLVQFLVERLKAPIPEAQRTWAVPILAMLISLCVCVCCRVGIFIEFGLTTTPVWLDYILTGLILSGGSTLTNELIKALQGIKTVGQTVSGTSLVEALLSALGITISEEETTDTASTDSSTDSKDSV